MIMGKRKSCGSSQITCKMVKQADLRGNELSMNNHCFDEPVSLSQGLTCKREKMYIMYLNEVA